MNPVSRGELLELFAKMCFQNEQLATALNAANDAICDLRNNKPFYEENAGLVKQLKDAEKVFESQNEKIKKLEAELKNLEQTNKELTLKLDYQSISHQNDDEFITD